MNLDELIDHALSLPEPWHVVGAEHHKKERKVELRVAHEESLGACPKCSKLASKYDSRSRRWRHLDMWDHHNAGAAQCGCRGPVVILNAGAADLLLF
jgi:hypothetical protein